MKTMLKTAFCLAVALVLTLGITFLTAPQADAGGPCPPCYVPDGASGWSQYGGCIGGPAHCPVYYHTYKNNRTGQICRGQFGVANI